MTLDDDTLRRLLSDLQRGEVRITGGVLTGDARAAAAYCDLCAAAPALAAEVLRLRAVRDAARRHVEARERLGDFAYPDDDDPEYGAAYAADRETLDALRALAGGVR